MIPAPLPDAEQSRLEHLHRYRILDTPPEETYDRITRLLARAMDIPITLVSLVDENRQWFKSRHGLDATETPRDMAFCAHALLGDEVFVVEDALEDERFHDNPLVGQAPYIRFYAGAPLTTSTGFKLGTLCAIDSSPRVLTGDQRQLLKDLARVIMDEMELRRALHETLNELAAETNKRRLLNDFFSHMAHELRTPLTSIKGSISLIENGVLGEVPRKMQDMVGVAGKNVEKMMTLVNDLLDIRKMEAGKFSYDFRTVDVADLLAETCARMDGYCVDKNVSLEREVGALPVMPADPDRLSQAVLNLLSNAVKFSRKGSSVRLVARHEGDSVSIEVIDNGSGIPEDLRPRLFSPFAQGASRDSPHKGTGLGLNIAKNIVEAHGGTIAFESTEGVGTTFVISLPVRFPPLT